MLTINIPTFNKPHLIKGLLSTHINIFTMYEVDVNIFDNSSNEETKKVYYEYKNKLKLNYFRNKAHLSADENFYQAYFYKKNDEYILLLGDTYKINEKLFEDLLKILNKKKYDFVILNHAGINNLKNIEFSNNHKLIETLSSTITCMSTLIFRKSIFIKDIYKKYINTNFIHAGILFDYIYKNNFLAYYLGNYSIERNYDSIKLETKFNWSYKEEVFDISVINWQNFIKILPSGYALELKKKIFLNFYNDLKIFSFKRLIYLRSKGILSPNFMITYKPYFFDDNYNLKKFYFKSYLFSLLPRVLCSFLIKLYLEINK